jgi:N-acetylmuramoyl-L-alanine amidase
MKENQLFTIQALETSHRERGFNGIGYHYYIRQSGEVINIRPLSRIATEL